MDINKVNLGTNTTTKYNSYTVRDETDHTNKLFVVKFTASSYYSALESAKRLIIDEWFRTQEFVKFVLYDNANDTKTILTCDPLSTIQVSKPQEIKRNSETIY